MGFVGALVKLFGALASWWQERQLIQAGEAITQAKVDEGVLADVKRTQDVRAAVGRVLADPGKLREHDEFERPDGE